jgi:hypothetical protein
MSALERSAEGFRLDMTASDSDDVSPAFGTERVLWRDVDSPVVFDPALSKRGPLTSVPTLMYLSEIGGRLRARFPLKVEVAPSLEGRFSVFSPMLSLGGIGVTIEEASRDLASTIESLWCSLVEERPEDLTDDAQQLAHRIRSTFADNPSA